MTTTQIYTVLITWMKNVLGSSILVTRGQQSSPKPAKEFFVIHQPMALVEYSTGNESMAYEEIENEGQPDEIIHGYVDYVRHWQATITIEEVGYEDNGDKLRQLLNSLRNQDIKSYFRSSDVSILRHEGITPIPQIAENIWELRSSLDLIIIFPDEGTYEPGYIETIEFEGTYNKY